MAHKRKTRTDSIHEINMGAEYTPEEIEFLQAMDAYMRIKGKRFPTFTEVLKVAKSLGYRKVDSPSLFPNPS